MPALCELVTPATPEAWAAYHDIRRKVLFVNRGSIYNPDHPDECSAQNFPKVLVHGGKYIGVVRIDFIDGIAYLRRVAIAETHQRKGFGRVLIGLAEAFCRDRGTRRVESAVASDAVTFYEKCGYRPLGPLSGSSVQMYRDLVAA